MGSRKKKLWTQLNNAFPSHFQDNSDERQAMQQRQLLIELDRIIDPDDPTLPDRVASMRLEIYQLMKPARLTGKNNQLDIIRSTYVANKITLQFENLPVTDTTSSIQFWQYLDALKKRHKPKSSRHEPIESV